MINQKFFTVLGGSSRTVVRAALLTEIYPINVAEDVVRVSNPVVLEGRIFGALIQEEQFNMSTPAIISAAYKEVGVIERTGLSGITISVPSIIAGSLQEIVKRVGIEESSLVVTLPLVLSGSLDAIVIGLSESSDIISVSGASVLSGSLS